MWNGGFCRNRNVCKEILGREIIAEAKVDARVVQEKRSAVFSRTSVMADLLCVRWFVVE